MKGMTEMSGQFSARIMLIVLALAGSTFASVAIAHDATTTVLFISLAAGWIMMVRHYEIALATLLVGFYTYPIGLEMIGQTPSSVKTLAFYALLSTAALIGGILRHPTDLRRIFRRTITLLGLMLALWTVANYAALSLGNDEAAKRLGYLALLSVAPLIAAQFIKERELHTLYWSSVGLILVGSIFTIRNLLLGNVDDMVRVSVDELVSPLAYAYSTGIAALMSLGLLISTKTSLLKRTLLLSQLGTATVVLVASGSRGPILALVVGVLLLMLQGASQSRRYIALIVVLAVLAVRLALPFVPTFSSDRLTTVLSATAEGALGDEFAESRGNIWLISLTAWRSRPVVGIGLGNFGRYGQGLATFSHNFLLESLTELGLIGFLILLLFLLQVSRSAYQTLQRSRESLTHTLPTLFAYAVVSMSLSGMLQASVDFWMVSALLAGANSKHVSSALAVRRDIRTSARGLDH